MIGQKFLAKVLSLIIYINTLLLASFTPFSASYQVTYNVDTVWPSMEVASTTVMGNNARN